MSRGANTHNLDAAALLLQGKQALVRAYLGISEYDDKPWASLFQHNDYQERFLELQTAGILPTSAELSYRELESDLSAWDIFFRKDNQLEKLVFFTSLLNLRCYPSAAECDRNHVWLWLVRTSNASRAIFNRLLDLNIIPSDVALNTVVTSGPNAGTNTWYWLARTRTSNTGRAIFDKLLDLNIIPSDVALNTVVTSGPNAGTNTWCWLAGSGDAGHAIFNRLLDLNIIPSDVTLNTVVTGGSNAGENTWLWLAGIGNTGRAIFNRLLDLNIIPSDVALNTVVTSGSNAGENTWLWLAGGGDTGHAIFNRLLDLNIIPGDVALTASTVSGPDAGVAVWSYLKFKPSLYARLITTKATKKSDPAIDDTIHLLFNNSVYQEAHLSALHCVGFLLCSSAPIIDVMFLAAEYLLPKPRLEQLNELCHTTNNEGLTIFKGEFLLSVWRFFFLTYLQKYINQNSFFNKDKDAQALLKIVVEKLERTDEPPAAIFKMLWLQLYTRKQAPQKNNKCDKFSEILACGIRLFPRPYLYNAFKKDELPRLTKRDEIDVAPR